MAHISIRGLDDGAMRELKRRAAQQSASVNALVLQLIAQGLGWSPNAGGPCRHDDLDALAGRWSAQEADEFNRGTVAFAEVDPAMWK